jgi:hypothetical protein
MSKIKHIGGKIRAGYQVYILVLFRCRIWVLYSGNACIVNSGQGFFGMQLAFVAFIVNTVKIVNTVGDIRCLLNFGN